MKFNLGNTNHKFFVYVIKYYHTEILTYFPQQGITTLIIKKYSLFSVNTCISTSSCRKGK